MSTGTASLIILACLLGLVIALIDYLVRLRGPGSETFVLTFSPCMLGVIMCDRYLNASGDIWHALPSALVIALSGLAAWVQTWRNANAAKKALQAEALQPGCS
jgi:hypothetical protein